MWHYVHLTCKQSFLQQFPRFNDNGLQLDWQWDRNKIFYGNVIHIPPDNKMTFIAVNFLSYTEEELPFFFLVNMFWFVLLNFRFRGFFCQTNRHKMGNLNTLPYQIEHFLYGHALLSTVESLVVDSFVSFLICIKVDGFGHGNSLRKC